jgi:hypothetical protein
MCTRNPDRADGILDASDGHLRAARAEWDRLTPGDVARIENKQDLITTVEECYGISHFRAVQDVELWDTRVRGIGTSSPRQLALTGGVS